MSYKLFTEKIGRAIDLYKDKKGWADTENELFVREIFSGDYNEKNLQGLKDLIVKHNQIFIYKREGDRMLVRRRQEQPSKTTSSRVAAFCKRFWEAVVGFFASLFGAKKGKEQPKGQDGKEEKRVNRPTNNRTRSRNTEGRAPRGATHRRPGAQARIDENGATAPREDKRRTRTEKTFEGNTPKRDGQERRARTGKGKERETNETNTSPAGSPRGARTSDTKIARKADDNPRRSASERRHEEGVVRLTDFAYMGSRDHYTEACKALLARIPEKIFTTDLDGEYHQARINLPVYLSQVFLVRHRGGNVLENGGYAAFHTGIFDNEERAVYALFDRNEEANDSNGRARVRRSAPAYRFYAFTTADESPAGVTLREHFSTLPSCKLSVENACIFPRQLFYHAHEPITNSEDRATILANSLFHLPREIIEQIPSLKGYDEKLSSLKGAKKVLRMRALAKEASLTDKEAYIALFQRVDEVVEKAFLALQSNPLLARPAFDPFRNTPFLLIPLDVRQTGSPDMMLELYSTHKGYEYGMLCPLSKGTLAMRTLSTLPTDWLTTFERKPLPNA